jgi:hypothetical protein
MSTMRSSLYQAALLSLTLVATCLLASGCGVSSAAPVAGRGDDPRGLQPMPSVAEGVVVFETGFEAGEDFPTAPLHSVTDDEAHSGRRSLIGTANADRPVCVYRIPIEGRKGHTLRVSLWRRSTVPVPIMLFLTAPNETTGETERHETYNIRSTGTDWSKVERTFIPDADRDVVLNILWPSTFGGRVAAATAWLDDVRIVDLGGAADFGLDHAEQFPALAVDEGGRFWLAVDERRDFASSLRPQVGVFRVEDGRRERVATLRPDGITGMSAPAVAPLGDGCLVAFGAEINGTYRMMYARVTEDPDRQPELETLFDRGNANIAPAVAADGDRVAVVWESNAHGTRGILASWVTSDGQSEPVLVSPPAHDARNPSVVAAGDGRMLAAWDSMRDGNVDIYGAWWRNGRWQPGVRLTRDPRIERHPSLAAHGGEVWLAWQAHSFEGRRINHVEDQPLVVARLDGEALEQPRGLWRAIGNGLYLRPRIAFDPQGRLWLTARESMGHNAGWQATAWCWGGGVVHGPQPLWSRTGRWR